MVLILSEENDVSTNQVIQWFKHFQIPFFRINIEDKINIEKISLSSNSFEISLIKNDSDHLLINDVKSYWYRRGDIELDLPQFNISGDKRLDKQFRKHVIAENKVIVQFIFSRLDSLPNITKFDKRHVNKLEILYLATLAGLKIPETIITSKKENLDTLKDYRKITKSLSSGFRPTFPDGRHYMTYTEDIQDDQIPLFFFRLNFNTEFKKK